MVKHFRLYLTGILALFALIVSGTIGLYDYYKGQQQILLNHEKEIEIIEESVMHAIHVVDQMYNLTDDALGEMMKEKMDILIDKYEQEPDIENWDFQELKEQFGLDVYVINNQNTIIFSSFEDDIGLNFAECCGSFADVIEQRRLNNEFVHDVMDLQQASGEMKKFAYMPSPDQKYLFELSKSLEDGEVYESFNILEKMAQLEKEYKPIQSIRMYNITGLSFGNEDDRKVSEKTRHVFEEAKRTNEKRELTRNINDKNVTYRYIPYMVPYEEAYPMKRMVEIVYNEAELEGVKNFYRESFIYQQLFILFAVVLLAIIIGRVISKPIQMAFYDSLTGLKNRAAFEVEGSKRLRKADKYVQLMMIDVDNFKRVNDELGHLRGDQLLADIAKAINRSVYADDLVARLGGDEFIVLCSASVKEKTIEQAERLLENLKYAYRDLNNQYGFQLSISIGIAYAQKEETLKDIYDRADQALYQAKRDGKNRYAVYESDDVESFH